LHMIQVIKCAQPSLKVCYLLLIFILWIMKFNRNSCLIWK
jgi:hypothetical protein